MLPLNNGLSMTAASRSLVPCASTLPVVQPRMATNCKFGLAEELQTQINNSIGRFVLNYKLGELSSLMLMHSTERPPLLVDQPRQMC